MILDQDIGQHQTQPLDPGQEQSMSPDNPTPSQPDAPQGHSEPQDGRCVRMEPAR
jgi:hypothetical protein